MRARLQNEMMRAICTFEATRTTCSTLGRSGGSFESHTRHESNKVPVESYQLLVLGALGMSKFIVYR